MVTQVANAAAARMEYWCNQANLGYGQGAGTGGRWDIRVGGAADCSSLVAFCYNEAGVSPKFPQDGRTYTGSLKSLCLARGFKVVSSSGLQRGDIVLAPGRHVEMYLGNGLIGGARINERGTITGGQPGDQTGRETATGPYYNFGQSVFLRHVSGAQAGTKTATTTKSSASSKNSAAATVKSKTILEEIAAMKATHIIFQIDNALYVADVLAGTYRHIPNVKTLNEMSTVISRAGGKLVYWNTLGAKSLKVSNPAAFGRLVK